MVAQGSGDAGSSGQPQDGDGQVAQAGHDLQAGRGADLGVVLVEVESRTQRRRSSMLHWPQMMAASWPGVAGVTLSEVTA